MANRYGAKRTRKNKMIVYRGERLQNVTLAPATIAIVGRWQTDRVAAMVESFSVAHSGPREFLEAMEYWADDQRLGSWSSAVEVAIWWGAGTDRQKGSDE